MRISSSLPWLSCALVTVVAIQAQGPPTEVVLHNFGARRPAGATPYSGVIRNAAGDLYGTTAYGGAANAGTVYKLDSTGKETVLYSFTGESDGSNPVAGLIADSAGNFYGTTQYGGTANSGVLYELEANGSLTVLYHFTGGNDGGNPQAGVIRDAAGNLYGTTSAGGVADRGVVFKLDIYGKETVLHAFAGLSDGENPGAGVIADPAGNLYGTTENGGSANLGVVYRVSASGSEVVLHAFSGPDGANPHAGVIRDSAGNLYGTTANGGTASWGVVYKIAASLKETVLYSFLGAADGANPNAGVIADAAGNLYGTASGGGIAEAGVTYKLDLAGNETVLHSFTRGTDGEGPYAGVI
jgi:uncharacterized repeat protein (TIGR03803 family)